MVINMVDIPIFETHMHYWDVNRFIYPWHQFESGNLNRNCLPKDFKKASKGYDVRKILIVEAGCVLEQVDEEVSWFVQLQKEEPRIAGIITRFDLDKGAAFAADLERAKKNSLICGGRIVLQAFPETDRCIDPDFLKAVRLLRDTGYVLDIGMDYRHNHSLLKFLEQVDGQIPCVIDHVGYPDILGGDANNWAKEFAKLAAFDNVYCKISSLTAKVEDNWNEEQIRPFVQYALEAFGSERVIFGSDWPTITKTLNADFARNAEMTWRFALDAGYSNEQLKQLFYKNAERLYKV